MSTIETAPIATTAPATEAPTATHAAVPVVGQEHAAPVDPAVQKAQEKEQAKFEKALNKDEKRETKTVHSAEKLAKKGTKAEAHALKAQAKAEKAVAKAKAKEVKYQQKLNKATKKHSDSVLTVQKAEEAHANAITKHNALVTERDNRNNNLKQTEAMKADHDVSVSPAGVSLRRDSALTVRIPLRRPSAPPH